MKREHIPCPKMLGEYVHIYRPLGDTYRAPDVRPEEPNEIWAPHLMKWQDGYRVIYSPQVIRAADSTDWKNWTVGNTLFYGDDTYMLSVFYPENGISAVRLDWK